MKLEYDKNEFPKILSALYSYHKNHHIIDNTRYNWSVLLLFTQKVLEALLVNNAGTIFIVFLFADPHIFEKGERTQDGTSNPGGVFPLG